MANPKKPTALKKLQGTDKQNKHRHNQSQPEVVRGIGKPASHLNNQQQKIWDEIVGNMYAGVLGEADRIALETLTRLVHEMRTDFTEMTAAKLTQMSNLLSRFGMTPSDRTKIVIPKQEKGSDWDAFKK